MLFFHHINQALLSVLRFMLLQRKCQSILEKLIYVICAKHSFFLSRTRGPPLQTDTATENN